MSTGGCVTFRSSGALSATAADFPWEHPSSPSSDCPRPASTGLVLCTFSFPFLTTASCWGGVSPVPLSGFPAVLVLSFPSSNDVDGCERFDETVRGWSFDPWSFFCVVVGSVCRIFLDFSWSLWGFATTLSDTCGSAFGDSSDSSPGVRSPGFASCTSSLRRIFTTLYVTRGTARCLPFRRVTGSATPAVPVLLQERFRAPGRARDVLGKVVDDQFATICLFGSLWSVVFTRLRCAVRSSTWLWRLDGISCL